MIQEIIEKMAHDFLASNRNAQTSKGHDWNADKGCVVESFIVWEGDPDFIPGSWVVGVRVPEASDHIYQLHDR